MIISDKKRRICYISHARVGKLHDYRFMKEEFPPDKNWFEEFNVKVDLGFLGIAGDYSCRSIKIPHKKPKNSELSEGKKMENKEISSERIIVEHSIGGLRRYRILADRLRTHDIDFYNEVLGVCAGLWNFYLDN